MRAGLAFVHDWLVDYGGAERCLKSLLPTYPESPVHTLFYDPRQFKGTGISDADNGDCLGESELPGRALRVHRRREDRGQGKAARVRFRHAAERSPRSVLAVGTGAFFERVPGRPKAPGPTPRTKCEGRGCQPRRDGY